MTKGMMNILIDHASATSKIITDTVCDIGQIVMTRISILQIITIVIILLCFALIMKKLGKIEKKMDK